VIDVTVICVDSGVFTIHPDAPGPPVTSKWESLGGDYDRKGLSENYGPQFGCIKWEFEVDGAISASVTIGPNDTVYVPCEDGNLYKLDSNGVVLWSYEANSPLISAPSIGPDGTAYVGAGNGRLHAVDINGNLRWRHGTGGMVYSSPAVSADGNSIYAGSEDGKLYALGQDGSELWSFETQGLDVTSGAILSSPTIGPDGTVYVGGFYDGNLYALDPNNGTVKWVCHFDSNGCPFASPVVAADGTIYQVLVYDSNLYAIEPNDGGIRWAASLSEVTREGTDYEWWSYSRWFEPYYHEGGYCDPLGAEQFTYRNAQYDVGDSGLSEPVLGPDGTIYVNLDDPYVRAVEPNGAIKWIRKVGSTMGYTLTVDSNSLIYAASDDSNLYVLDSRGFEVARFDSNDYWLGFPVVSADNTLIVGDSRDNSMLISYENNKLWAIGGDCQGQDPNLYWQGGGQDVDGDGKVDNKDLKAVADCWLRCTDCEYYAYRFLCGPVEEQFLAGDINRDFYVDFFDFATLAQRWLAGY
jgi:outer membrane protein assembly factor BamB